MFTSGLLNNILFQIVGKYYLRIDPLGEGARWRRSFGQEIYSPLLVAFTEQVGEKKKLNLKHSSPSGRSVTHKK